MRSAAAEPHGPGHVQHGLDAERRAAGLETLSRSDERDFWPVQGRGPVGVVRRLDGGLSALPAATSAGTTRDPVGDAAQLEAIGGLRQRWSARLAEHGELGSRRSRRSQRRGRPAHWDPAAYALRVVQPRKRGPRVAPDRRARPRSTPRDRRARAPRRARRPSHTGSQHGRALQLLVELGA